MPVEDTFFDSIEFASQLIPYTDLQARSGYGRPLAIPDDIIPALSVLEAQGPTEPRLLQTDSFADLKVCLTDKFGNPIYLEDGPNGLRLSSYNLITPGVTNVGPIVTIWPNGERAKGDTSPRWNVGAYSRLQVNFTVTAVHGSGTADIVFQYSTDGGTTWTGNMIIGTGITSSTPLPYSAGDVYHPTPNPPQNCLFRLIHYDTGGTAPNLVLSATASAL